ncbi:MAG: DsrH/TusB family sulfur relay protein, partial [Deltaproteobacteria bacterium]|nr:DsrH/TusB family sulfur relay protein [Deltaproteobacteria bacterium]
YTLAAKGAHADTVKKIMKTNPVYGLGPDIKARGINEVVADVKLVDYEGFVDLVEEHQVNSWL